MMDRRSLLIFLGTMTAGCGLFSMPHMTAAAAPSDSFQGQEQKPVVLAHYMPWFEANAEENRWGWHWTMNHFQTDKIMEGRRPLASHYYPLIGPYDSGDRTVIEYHLLTMKMAGIDGVIVDWYGRSDFRDYPMLHRNTTRILQQCERLKMKFVICYEDQTRTALQKAGRLREDQRVTRAVEEIRWLSEYWFQSPSYLREDGRPVLLSFGFDGLKEDEWRQCLQQLDTPLAYYSQNTPRQGAVGAFDWPSPANGLQQAAAFAERSVKWNAAIPSVYPRFHDIYREANVSDGYATIADDDGATLHTTLQTAVRLNSEILQLVTWNDWGEGTQLEPSVEFQYRDLEWIRSQFSDSAKSAGVEWLRIPLLIFALRQQAEDSATQFKAEEPATIQEKVDQLIQTMNRGEWSEAKSRLNSLLKREEVRQRLQKWLLENPACRSLLSEWL